jgi:hypothetical protein
VIATIGVVGTAATWQIRSIRAGRRDAHREVY